MKLHEAIYLGSTLIKAQRGTFGAPGGPGCAIGMGCEAIDSNRQVDASLALMVPMSIPSMRPLLYLRDVDKLIETFPVLRQATDYPCECGHIAGWGPQRNSLSDVIIHLFDHHVMLQPNDGTSYSGCKKKWSMEHLIDFIRLEEECHEHPVASPVQEEEHVYTSAI